ncbi:MULTISPECIES: RNA polymerase sigma factor [Flavobacteriaceae]|uniref:Sigma-70 family RNA polymerase sigma factor n=1 Tax=Flagellimonas alvinocaridis TaxID=2530200 RepID=A0A4V4HX47_9FLAO|nr:MULTISPECIES: sigma-70 family RNA polymerase sigma factor [Allomuricauda]MDC6362970.1 sigma-70 family RNA polymerase sigma factor [Muricauda sp. SP22]THV59596.1 sigma-70 family RNA polymerase sigma factor [Allomuricauda alvinocaridis]
MHLDNLIQRFQNKDKAAFETLHNMYAENICGVINVILKDPERSQELCQDVFVKIWNKSDQYDTSKGRFFTWILNIARNTAIDELRSKSHKNQKKNLPVDSLVGIYENSEDLNGKIDTIGLQSLLKGLKDKCILLIDLLYFKGFTQKEAAKELKTPIGTIKTRIRSCISEIRKNLPQ